MSLSPGLYRWGTSAKALALSADLAMELATERHDCEAGFGDRFGKNSSAMPAKGKGSVYRPDPFA
jgi:hypothetical protein